MAIPISIKDLLEARRVESTRVEYKASWNPEKVLHSICAFANDIDNTGGGYIILGISEENGRPILPPVGLNDMPIDAINKRLVELCRMLEPSFLPIVEPVEFEGVDLLVIRIPGGKERPYRAPVNILKNAKSEKACYIRKMACTIRANATEEKELYDLAGNVPFDDCINHRASVDDLKRGLLESYLKSAGSALAKTVFDRPLRDIANDMLLLDGSPEDEHPRNVALLFFNDSPERFFPFSRVEIIDKPNPTGQGMKEKIITGPIDRQLSESLAYIRNAFLKEIIFKRPDDEKADRFWNYPYAAIEEALSNAIFHKSYAIHEPITVMVMPDRIEITSVPGPDRSISNNDLKSLRMVSRRCRNRRIWEFLKELELVEGRNTGVPTMVEAMRANGSPDPIFLTDDERSYLTVVLPIRRDGPSSGINTMPNTVPSEGNTLPVAGNTVPEAKNTLPDTLPDTLPNPKNTLPAHSSIDTAILLLEAIRNHPGNRIPFFVDLLGKGERTLMRYISYDLKDRVEFRGAPKTGGYYIKEP